jgi:hypothetical protein
MDQYGHNEMNRARIRSSPLGVFGSESQSMRSGDGALGSILCGTREQVGASRAASAVHGEILIARVVEGAGAVMRRLKHNAGTKGRG